MVDLRARRAFAAGHVPGSLSFEYGDSFATHLGWLLPPGTPLTLIADDPGADRLRPARPGPDRHRPDRRGRGPAGASGGRASYPVSDFAGLAQAWDHQPPAVLDVRRRLEWASGHIEGALHLPLHYLPGRVPDLPPGPIWVHCQAGYRAAIAASILHAAGRAVTAIDDSYDHAADAGLPVTHAPLTTGARL